MRQSSPLYKELFRGGGTFGYEISFGSEHVTTVDFADEPVVVSGIAEGEFLSVGSVYMSIFDFALKEGTMRTPDKDELITVYFYMRDTTGRESERIKYGIYRITSREVDRNGRRIIYESQDSIGDLEKPVDVAWIRSLPVGAKISVGTLISKFPETVSVNTANLDTSMEIPYIDLSSTWRLELSYVCIAQALNARVNPDGEVEFIRLAGPEATPATDIDENELNNKSFESFIGNVVLIGETGVRYQVPETGGAGSTLTATLPWASKLLAESLLAKVIDVPLKSAILNNTEVDPCIEPGDTVHLNYDDNDYVISNLNFTMGARPYGFISSGDFAQFGNSGSPEQYMGLGTVKQGRYYYGVSLTRDEGLVVVREGDPGIVPAKAVLNTDELYFSIDGVKILEADFIEKTMIFRGRLSADILNAIQGIVTPFLFAENGLIMNAVVQRLRTDLEKPWKFLANDMSTMYYRDIYENQDHFLYATVMLDTQGNPLPAVQYTIPAANGMTDSVCWWYYDPGSPETQIGGKITVSEEYSKTPDGISHPVMVYQYDESYKMQLGYYAGSDNIEPGIQIILGEGTGDDKNRLILDKDVTSGGFRWVTNDGVEHYLRVDDEGWHIFPPLEGGGGALSPISIDMYEDDVQTTRFVTQYENGVTADYNVEYDGEGRIISLVDNIETGRIVPLNRIRVTP